MKAGRELDALIAEKVMGKPVKWGKTPTTKYPIAVAHYSTQIADAWLVVEKMEEHNDIVLFDIVRKTHVYNELYWFARFRTVLVERPNSITKADTAPLAICLAALKAVG